MSSRINGQKVARLMYLLQTNPGLKIPGPLIPYVPGAKWIVALVTDGAGAVDVDLTLVQALIEEGAKFGPGDVREGVILIQNLVDETLRRDTKLELSRRLKIYRMLEGLQATIAEYTVEIDLSDPGEIVPIPKFDTGFQPLDQVMGGVYQAIIVLLGPPGSGKTSLMVSMMETLRQRSWEGSLLMIENEIPAPMMKGRFEDVFRRTSFIDGDKLICGPWSASTILDYVKEHPDPNRVVFFDSPDVVTQSENSFSKKLFQEAEYLTLMELRRLCATILVSSWPNRKETMVTHYNQISDAVEKARYADCIIGINPMANDRVQFVGLKNRFGPNGTELTFHYDYQTLLWEPGSIQTLDTLWDQFTEDAKNSPEEATNGNTAITSNNPAF